MTELSPLEKRVLDAIQRDIPLEERPFRSMAGTAGCDEETLIRTLDALMERDLIREISAIYNARGLGYGSTLVALSTAYPNPAAALISRHPGVSHNYYREHDFNIWFTLTLPVHRDFDNEIRGLLEGADYNSYRILPALRTFKLGVNFRYSGEQSKKQNNSSPQPASAVPVDRELIRELQKPFPLVPRPWRQIASALKRDEKGLVAEIEELKQARVIRRISGIVRHRKTGFKANGMACFRLPPERIEEAGLKAASYSAVSHCYERPVYPDWPYPLFAMTHGRTEQECERIIAEIAREIGAGKPLILYSTKEYKKERVRYFLEEEE